MQTFEDFVADYNEYGYETKYPVGILKNNFAETNGCGAKGGIDVPDTMWGMPISGPCNIHDIEWLLAKDYFDLVDANQRFRRNIEKKIDKYSSNRFMVFLRMRRLHKYYDAVKLIGTRSYAEECGFEIH